MSPRFRILLLFFVFFMGMFLLTSQTHAAKTIAKVSSFKGEVIILSGKKFITIKPGLALKDGDTIQTRDGEVEITFNDGAVLRVRHFTNSMIQEGEERAGFFTAKIKGLTRRITCFVGYLWFKSVKSETKNYLQTPTAVCGVRGTVVEWGYDLVMSYLNVVEGDADVFGPVIRGFFRDLGQAPSRQSSVYIKLARAEKTRALEDVRDALIEALTKILENPNLPDEVKARLQADLNALERMPEAELRELIEKLKDETETTGQELYQEEMSPSQ